MSYGRCCVTEPRSRPALQLDIFIEILLILLVLSKCISWMVLAGTEDGFVDSAIRWLEGNRPSVPLETLTADRDRRELAV